MDVAVGRLHLSISMAQPQTRAIAEPRPEPEPEVDRLEQAYLRSQLLAEAESDRQRWTDSALLGGRHYRRRH